MAVTEAGTIIELITKDRYVEMLGELGDWQDGYAVVDVIEGDERSWALDMETIVQAPSGKYFSVTWERPGGQVCGLFEDSVPDPIEVERVESKVVTWPPKDYYRNGSCTRTFTGTAAFKAIDR